MKYSNEIVIDLPRNKVIELFDNPENMKYWQKGLVNFECISGEEGKSGARSKLSYQMGKRSVEMVETIVENSFPENV
ncbi:MAG: SRPBCC family protein [Ekhidna sp.]